ncbi:MAG TPA: tetratricopeptide repeat protein, partial [Blastocatellia bacterium]|nr:tetratricopeptide repeat protein [Blastocatellia bacterium]
MTNLLSVVAPPAHASASERVAAQSAQESISLEAGEPIEREFSGGQSHSYKITLSSGQYLQVVVSQRGIDAIVTLFTPDGKKIREVDSERTIVGSETISEIANAAGVYKINVRSAERTAKTGRYEIKVEELRKATVEDRYRVDAESAFREAEKLRQGTLEEKRKSVEKYHEALELYRRAGDCGKEALTLNGLGLAHIFLGETQKALENHNEALPLSRAAGDLSMEATTLKWIGMDHWALGEMSKFLEKFNESLLIYRAAGDRRGEGDMLYSIGLFHTAQGEMGKALEKLNQALPIYREIADRRGEGKTLNDIGYVYESLGEMEKALEKYKESLPLSQAVNNRMAQAATLNSIGRIYRRLGDMPKALEKYNQALHLSRAAGVPSYEADTLDNIGEIYRSRGEIRKALGKHNEAMLLRKEGPTDRRAMADTLHKIGEVYRSLGETQKALNKFNEALSLSRAVGARDREAVALLAIARVKQTRGLLPQAQQTIEQAIGIVESLRTDIREDLRASYFASLREYYESYIDILTERHRQNQAAGFDAMAFAVSERSRARSLLELLAESRADIRQGVDGSLLERERSLRGLLQAKAAAQFALLNRKHTPEQAEALAKE